MSDGPHCERIAIYLPNLAGGGVERAYLELGSLMLQYGIAVDLILARRIGPYIAEIPVGMRVVELCADRKAPIVFWLADYLNKVKPDALLSGGDISNSLAVLASILVGRTQQCVISQRGVIRPTWQAQRPITWRAWMILLKILYRLPRCVICNSEAAQRELVEGFGLKESRCPVIYNHVNSQLIQLKAKLEDHDSWFEPKGDPIIISVGSLTAGKDMATLIKAFAIVRKAYACRLLILGEGAERRRLHALVRDLELEHCVRIPGFVNNPFPMIKSARVFVSASLAEGCPNVIQQALACGTRIVATDCPGGTAAILENGRWGRLVPVADPTSMASAIVASLHDPNPPDGTTRAADFTPEKVVRAYVNVLLPGFAASQWRQAQVE